MICQDGDLNSGHEDFQSSLENAFNFAAWMGKGLCGNSSSRISVVFLASSVCEYQINKSKALLIRKFNIVFTAGISKGDCQVLYQVGSALSERFSSTCAT